MARTPNRFSKMRKVSGSRLGKMSKYVIGCEQCNFMKDKRVYDIEFKDAQANDPSIRDSEKLKTGSICPRCDVNSIRTFDSMAEFGRSRELRMLVTNGDISDLEYQVKFPLYVLSDNVNIGMVPIYSYVADFTYTENGVSIVEDVKNSNMVVTDVAVMKMKHFEAQHDKEIRLIGR